MMDLQRELSEAQRLARDRRCAFAFDFPVDIAGVGFVEIVGGVYQPAADGDPAVIVAAEAEGQLVDLVACRLSDRATATRLGVAALLGEDAVEVARHDGRTLLVYCDPLHWLGAGCLGVAILDWKAVRWTIAGVPRVTCATPELEKRLRRAFMLPTDLPAFIQARRAA